jgi:hypothetical protein
LDAGTLQPKWNFFIDKIGIRGGMSVTGGMVIVPCDDGVLRFISEASGTLVYSKVVGGAMITTPAIGTDANGVTRIIEPVSAPTQSGGVLLGVGLNTAGFIFAIGPPSGQGASTTTSVSVSTVVSTSVQTVQGTSGIDPTTFYAVAGVAVVLAIAAGFFAMRGRKPAP